MSICKGKRFLSFDSNHFRLLLLLLLLLFLLWFACGFCMLMWCLVSLCIDFLWKKFFLAQMDLRMLLFTFYCHSKRFVFGYAFIASCFLSFPSVLTPFRSFFSRSFSVFVFSLTMLLSTLIATFQIAYCTMLDRIAATLRSFRSLFTSSVSVFFDWWTFLTLQFSDNRTHYSIQSIFYSKTADALKFKFALHFYWSCVKSKC